MNKTPILDELRITIEGAVALFDAEPDEDHPDPIDDAIELVREAESLLPEAGKRLVEIPEAGPGDEDGENQNRDERAYRTLLVYQQYSGSDKEDALCDLLGDLLHYANRNGEDFAYELRRACDHFAAETANGPE
jgi:hypothetical protein